MSALLTPQLVQQIAESLGATSGSEWALAYALANWPLPKGWVSLASEDGLVSYVHDSGLLPPQPEHPLLPSAQHVLSRLRRQQAADPDAAAASSVKLLGPFEDYDSPGTEFFFLDVQTGERVPEYECPPGLIIPELPEELRQQLSEAAEEGAAEQEEDPPYPDGDEGQGREESREQQQQEQTWEQERERASGSGVSEPEGQLASEPSAPSAFGRSTFPEEEGFGARPPSRYGEGDFGYAGAGAAAGGAAGPGGAGSRPVSAAASAASRPASSGQAAARAALDGLTLDPGDSAGGGVEGGGGGGDSGGGDGAAGAAARGLLSRSETGVSGGGVSIPSRSGTVDDTMLLGSASSVMAEPSRGVGSSALSDLAAASAAAAPAAPPGSRPPSAASPAARPSSSAGAGAARGGPGALRMSEASYGSGRSVGTGGMGGGGGGGGVVSGRASRKSGAGSLAGGNTGSPVAARSRAVSAVSARSGGGGGGAGGGGYEDDSNGSDGGGSVLSGGGSRGSAGGDVRGPAPPPSGRLTFFGWWFEDIESSDLTFRIDCKQTAGGGLAPRHCALSYDLASASFTFSARDPVTPPAPGQPTDRVPELVVRGIRPEQVTLCETGRPAEVWDLHLGARLVLLGRPLVLKNAELATAQWHAGHCRRLAALREQLAQELQKYKPRVLRPGLVRDKGLVRLQTGQALRHMAAQVREMAEDLRQYRPAKAESFLEALPVLV